MKYKILLIDDMPALHHLIKAELSAQQFEVLSAYDGKAGLAAAATMSPDLILLDVDMPAMLGYEVCRQLKAERATRAIPVIFLTAAHSVDDRIRGLDAGACDFVTKPVDPAELRARVRAALRTKKTFDEVAEKVIVDELTELFDRKYFETQLDMALATVQRSGKSLGLILADIDHMHVLNDAFGNKLGDEMLRVVSQCLLQICRRQDVLCRFGGDEFALLVTDTEASVLHQYADRIRIAVRSAVVYDSQRAIQVTATMGTAISSLNCGVSLVAQAEEAVCRGKLTGGDCVRAGRETASLSMVA